MVKAETEANLQLQNLQTTQGTLENIPEKNIPAAKKCLLPTVLSRGVMVPTPGRLTNDLQSEFA